MAEYKAYSPNAEVLGRAVLVVVYAMPAYEARVREFMTEEGIGGVGPDDWVPQQSWLNVLGKVTDAFGDYTLRSIGTSIPDHALFPPSVKDFRSAMEALDEAYYLNHKGGDIGHYRLDLAAIESRQAIMECRNPYPPYFDLGIISALCAKFPPSISATCKVDWEQGHVSRLDGGETCRFLITW
jgi:hypothetical protein